MLIRHRIDQYFDGLRKSVEKLNKYFDVKICPLGTSFVWSRNQPNKCNMYEHHTNWLCSLHTDTQVISFFGRDSWNWYFGKQLNMAVRVLGKGQYNPINDWTDKFVCLYMLAYVNRFELYNKNHEYIITNLEVFCFRFCSFCVNYRLNHWTYSQLVSKYEIKKLVKHDLEA